MRWTAAGLAAAALLGVVMAQNCGPQYGNQICAAGKCCSQYGWCDTGAAWCDPSTCQPQWSGPGSSCAKLLSSSSSSHPTSQRSTSTSSTTKKSSSSTSSYRSSTTSKPASTFSSTSISHTSTSSSSSTSTFNGPYVSTLPDIDTCGAASGSSNVSCPGAGINGYFYRCCSGHGHCGPKNNIQDESIYCGVAEAGCQPGFGSCNASVPKPPNPTGTPGIAQPGDTCGPIVNMVCSSGYCCSGSNYCGTGPDFCGSANWCQPQWGSCSGN